MAEITTEHITLSVADGTTMPAYTARPAGGAHGGIIVLQEAFGVNHHIRDVTERFAREGYVSIAPPLFHRTDPKFECGYDDFSIVMPHMQAVTVEGVAADVTAAYEWLTAGGVDRIAAIGYCLGGRSAWIANATVALKASISYYGGGIAQSLLDLTSKLGAPQLLFWGGQDKHILAEHRRAVADSLDEAGKDFVEVNFAKADHGFFCDERSAYNPEAARQAWALTKVYLDTYMG